LNPAECFDGIMVDYSYCECSSAAIRTLLLFRKYYPTHRSGEI
jgi:squalene cyclase